MKKKEVTNLFLKGEIYGREETIKDVDKFMEEHTCSSIASTSEGTCIDTSFVRFPCFVWEQFKKDFKNGQWKN